MENLKLKSYPVWCEQLSDMWLSTLEIGAAQLRFVAEIAPKSPLLNVNRSPSVRYDFRAGAKAVQYSVNVAYNSLLLSRFSPTPSTSFEDRRRKREFDRVPKPTPQKFQKKRWESMSKALHSSLLRKTWNRDSRKFKKTKYKKVFLSLRYWCIFRGRSKQLKAQIPLMLLQFPELFPVNNSNNSLITLNVSSHRCGNREIEKSKLVI